MSPEVGASVTDDQRHPVPESLQKKPQDPPVSCPHLKARTEPPDLSHLLSVLLKGPAL